MIRYWRSILFLIFIFVICTIPIPKQSAEVNLITSKIGFDKMVHFILFYILIRIVIFESTNLIKFEIILSMIFALAAIIEFIQFNYSSTRSAEWADFYASIAGGFFAIIYKFKDHFFKM
jgi:hypothetical protein